MRARLTRLVVLAALLTAPAITTSAQPVDKPMNEITPFGAFVAGGEPDPSGAYGVTYSRFLNADQAIDVTILFQPTTVETEEGSIQPEVDFDVEYYHVGGRYAPVRQKKSKVHPYVSMSLGASRFVASPGDDELGFSVGFGGGADMELSKRVWLRLDARLFTTIALSSGVIYCEPQYCTAFTNGSVFSQFAGSAGLVFKF